MYIYIVCVCVCIYIYIHRRYCVLFLLLLSNRSMNICGQIYSSLVTGSLDQKAKSLVPLHLTFFVLLTGHVRRPGPVRHGPLDHLYYRLGAGPCAHRVQRLQVCQCGSAAVGLFCALDRSLLPYAQASFASYACLRHASALVAGLFCSSRSLLPHRLISLATDTGLF